MELYCNYAHEYQIQGYDCLYFCKVSSIRTIPPIQQKTIGTQNSTNSKQRPQRYANANLAQANHGNEIRFTTTHGYGPAEGVQGLIIDSLVLQDLSLKLNEPFPYLIAINITFCGLKMVSAENLAGLALLEQLNLKGNQLISIPDDLFMYTKNIKWIDFSENKLVDMSWRLFDPIPKNQLMTVDLRNNTNINVVYDRASGPGSLEVLEKAVNAAFPSFEVKDTIANLTGDLKMISSSGFEKIWKLENFSDFTIVVGEKEFHVHKIVLATQSSVFASMLETDDAVKTSNKLEIKDCSEEVVEEFLRALYVGEINDGTQNNENALNLLSLASTFDVPQLKALCEELAVEELNGENALKALTLGNLYKSEGLIDAAFAEIKKKYSEVVIPDALKNQPDRVKEIVKTVEEFNEMIKNLTSV